ncbi:MFS transporter [Iamia sp. SCSIO 61187]|uniref:MFS transporter n=1 Tax=Iamia sp. SCSIO 61187 TaxID=2722752 RepID=UPI001C635247|nr:MFS transporter [Iamia sp. SCSIO 61187]QYG94474.1 MFS transporter [Iamia sp. SCSIO 61187]
MLGYSALIAAAGLLPMAAMMMPLSTTAPTIAERIGFRRTLVTGMLLLAAGLALFAVLADADSGYASVLPGMLVIGAGVGLAMSPSTSAITSSLPEEKQGVASALNDTVREMGGAVGIALIGSVLNAGYRSAVEPATVGVPDEAAEPVRDGIGGALAVAESLSEAGVPLADVARRAFVEGMAPPSTWRPASAWPQRSSPPSGDPRPPTRPSRRSTPASRLPASRPAGWPEDPGPQMVKPAGPSPSDGGSTTMRLRTS